MPWDVTTPPCGVMMTFLLWGVLPPLATREIVMMRPADPGVPALTTRCTIRWPFGVCAPTMGTPPPADLCKSELVWACGILMTLVVTGVLEPWGSVLWTTLIIGWVGVLWQTTTCLTPESMVLTFITCGVVGRAGEDWASGGCPNTTCNKRLKTWQPH